MKLSQLVTDDNKIVKTVFKETTGMYSDYPSLSYHLLKSISEHINEDSTFVDYGISKLRGMLTPNISSKYSDMLVYMAPQGNGIKGLNSLINSAKEYNESIFKNKQWFDQLFKALGIDNDPQLKPYAVANIKRIYKSSQSDGSYSRSEKDSLPGSYSKRNDGAPVGDTQSSSGEGKPSEIHPSAKQMIAIERLMRAMVTKQITDQEGSAKLLQLAQALYNSYNQAEVKESLDLLASVLLDNREIASKSHIIIPDAIHKSSNLKIIKEADWQAIRDKLSKGLGALANPEVVKSKFSGKTIQANNERISKSIISMILEKMYERYIKVLGVLKVTPELATNILNKMKRNKFKNEEQKRKVFKAYNKITQVFLKASGQPIVQYTG